MTQRWQLATRAEKFVVGFLSLSFLIIWIGAQIEFNADLGFRILSSGVILLASTIVFGLAYAVDWDG